MDNTDPFAVIAEEAPAFSDEEAIATAAARYGWQVTVRSLVSERDQNFRLALGDGRKFVLKIANAAEDPQVTDFQIQALLHIAKRADAAHLAVIAPEIVPTLDGDVSFTLEKDGRRHAVRAVTWLEGVPLADQQASPALARDAGGRLAELGRTLEGFDHPGSRHSLLWDIQQALLLRRLLHHVRDADIARAVEGALDDYEQHVTPAMAALRSQVIHGDLNPDNMLIAAENPEKVVGVIDFGDMLHAPLIADLAIACCYLRVAGGDPLALIAEMIASYHAVTPLARAEIDVLFELIQARLAASITILEWRSSLRGDDDPYLAKLDSGERSAGYFLLRLREVPREHVIQVFRQVCASVGD